MQLRYVSGAPGSGIRARTRVVTTSAHPHWCSSSKVLPCSACRPSRHRGSRMVPQAAEEPLDVQQIASMVMLENLEPERQHSLEQLAAVMEVPIGTAKNMVFKRKALLGLTADEISERFDIIAQVVEVTRDQARQMAAHQPGLLFDTQKQAETLKYGIQAICYELDAPKDEVVHLIINNPSVLHGRELRLSVADMAHLAMLREPRGRIVD